MPRHKTTYLAYLVGIESYVNMSELVVLVVTADIEWLHKTLHHGTLQSCSILNFTLIYRITEKICFRKSVLTKHEDIQSSLTKQRHQSLQVLNKLRALFRTLIIISPKGTAESADCGMCWRLIHRNPSECFTGSLCRCSTCDRWMNGKALISYKFVNFKSNSYAIVNSQMFWK